MPIENSVSDDFSSTFNVFDCRAIQINLECVFWQTVMRHSTRVYHFCLDKNYLQSNTVITRDPSIYTMDRPRFIVSTQRDVSICTYGVLQNRTYLSVLFEPVPEISVLITYTIIEGCSFRAFNTGTHKVGTGQN